VLSDALEDGDHGEHAGELEGDEGGGGGIRVQGE
jgi:hypothetical protein